MWSIVLERIGGYFRNEVRIGLFLGRWLIRVRLFCFGGFIVSKVFRFLLAWVFYMRTLSGFLYVGVLG